MRGKITIIMAYLDRKDQLLKTLESFRRYADAGYNFGVVIVDDMSNDDNRLEGVIRQYPFRIKLIRITSKKWINPCIAYNTCINHVPSDTEYLVIQNPEIFHCGDVLGDVLSRLKPGHYKTYSVYNCPDLKFNDEVSGILKRTGSTSSTAPYLHLIKQTSRKHQVNPTTPWYNHPLHRPNNFHFLSAIHMADFRKVGGFDNAFKDGVAYDDNELLFRIGLVCKVECNGEVNRCFGLHLFHHPNHLHGNVLWKRNETIFTQRTKKSRDPYRNPITNVEKEITINTVGPHGNLLR